MDEIEKICSRYSYNVMTGEITNKRTGRPVLTEEDGYIRRITVDGKRYQPTHIIWAVAFRKFPEYEIDHKDDNGLNNRLENLQDIPHALNIAKGYVRKTGKAWESKIVPGEKNGEWLAYVMWQDGSNRFEYFDDINAAIEQKLEWERDIAENSETIKPGQIRTSERALDWMIAQHPEGWIVGVRTEGKMVEKIFDTEQQAEDYKRAWINLR